MNSQGSTIYEINLIDTWNSVLHRNYVNRIFYPCESPMNKKKGSTREREEQGGTEKGEEEAHPLNLSSWLRCTHEYTNQ